MGDAKGEKLLTLAPLPAYQCYDCKGCGDCCRGIFAIEVTAGERDRILAQGWEDDPELRGGRLFEARAGKLLLAHREDGSCVFLDERGLCRIHARFGEPAKPRACRLYPFRFIPAGADVRADLRYDCPAAARSQGRPLSEHRRALKELLPLVLPPAVAELPAPPLFGRARSSWPRLCCITEAFDRLLRDEELDLTRRIACCVNLAAALRLSQVAALDGEKLRDFLGIVSAKALDMMREDPFVRIRPPAIVRVAFRQMLGAYGREDRRGERGVLLRRLRAALRMLAGSGEAPRLRRDFPEGVPFAALEEPIGIPPDDVVEPLARYYRVRLQSMGFFGPAFYGTSYLDGLNALMLTYPLTFWLARAHAQGRGLPAPDRDSIAWGIHVVSHHHGMSPVFGFLSERIRLRFLCERENLRALAIWYGS